MLKFLPRIANRTDTVSPGSALFAKIYVLVCRDEMVKADKILHLMVESQTDLQHITGKVVSMDGVWLKQTLQVRVFLT